MKITTFAALFAVASSCYAQDMPLSQVLIDGEGWEIVSEGHDFTDACASDAEGNFYFTDVKGGPGIYKVDTDGKVSVWIDNLPGLSGIQFGPDGRIYACQGKLQRVISIAPGEKEPKVLLENVRPNDLVVTADGGIYFTHTGPQKIEYISPDGKHRTVHEGDIVRPNGITLSPDQGTLIVSDHGGKHVWAFRIEEDGSLSHPSPWMTVRTASPDSEVSRGDGSATDAYGRFYVTTEVGIHMYDPTGRLGGVIANPQPQVVSCEFGGPNLEYLYVAGADKIFRRKTKSKGVLFQDGPVPILRYKP
ncbi:MAG: gluconolactonase [Verrucomicrobiales bacterium]|jgi:gluconolactonase